MGRRAWAAVLALCLLTSLVTVVAVLEQAWTPASPPRAGVQVSSSPPDPVGRAPGSAPLQDLPVQPGRQPAEAPPPVAPPATLTVPALGVTAPVDAVGTEADGAMTIPADGRRVGWYRHGSAPGSPEGSAVLAGHVDTRAGGPGALFRLSSLEPGAEIVVTTSAGEVLRYTVTAREQVAKTALPTEALFAREGPPRLRVITCGGPFDRDLARYRDNVVVTAELVERTGGPAASTEADPAVSAEAGA